jgi:hypothetical protein
VAGLYLVRVGAALVAGLYLVRVGAALVAARVFVEPPPSLL